MTDLHPSNTAFEELLNRARTGDAAALDQVLGLTESRLLRHVERCLGPQLRASLRRSDVLQNSYLAMLAALPSFPGRTPDDFVAWVSRIIEHDIHRQTRWFGAAMRRPPSRTSERNTLARILLEPTPTPSAECAKREEQELIRNAMERLDPLHAQVLELAIFEALPHREIAQRMQRTDVACRMLLMRARAALAIEVGRLDAGQHGDGPNGTA